MHFTVAMAFFALSLYVKDCETDKVAWSIVFLITLSAYIVDTLPRKYKPGVLYRIIVFFIICARNIMLASFFIRFLNDLLFYIRLTMRLRKISLMQITLGGILTVILPYLCRRIVNAVHH